MYKSLALYTCNIRTILILFMAASVHFSRCPNVPLIQGPGEKGRTSGPEPRVSRLMSRSASCTMKMPKGDLLTYAPNGQVRYPNPHSFTPNLGGEKLLCFIIHYITFITLSYFFITVYWHYMCQ